MEEPHIEAGGRSLQRAREGSYVAADSISLNIHVQKDVKTVNAMVFPQLRNLDQFPGKRQLNLLTEEREAL